MMNDNSKVGHFFLYCFINQSTIIFLILYYAYKICNKNSFIFWIENEKRNNNNFLDWTDLLPYFSDFNATVYVMNLQLYLKTQSKI